MNKNIQTQNADINLIQKFLDYANCADASYAMLHWVNYVKKDSEDKNEQGDKQILGDKFNGKNSTYARTIEARFQKDKIIGKNYLFLDKAINNDITQVKLDSKLSQRAIDFVNRFRLLAHQENKERSREKGRENDGNYGFSATLFQNKESQAYILAIRGTEPKNISDIKADARMALGYIPHRKLMKKSVI